MTKSYENVRRVTFNGGRWTITIRLELEDGTEQIYYASADTGMTWGDGIWFGTKEEWDGTEL